MQLIPMPSFEIAVILWKPSQKHQNSKKFLGAIQESFPSTIYNIPQHLKLSSTTPKIELYVLFSMSMCNLCLPLFRGWNDAAGGPIWATFHPAKMFDQGCLGEPGGVPGLGGLEKHHIYLLIDLIFLMSFIFHGELLPSSCNLAHG